ncbi:hypothetical protein [Kibdelosporangium aridum]|uniref:DUF4386 domain-containing protein n=1 Tax=Kibdelosporangium aridum TaxID=2030 RepID=A0A1W2FWB8_KIBAR|nr:hypothetical protein [Kibdelosporangium aridum]SMD26032.1 hypothetical protein SAMN05661093_09610 [Kibdelosporangium aridum]
MFRTQWSRAILIALPGLLLAGFGAVHPAPLDAANAHWWTTMHVLLLPVFPLLAVAQWVLLAPAHPAVRWTGRVAAFGFAVFYDGLDAVAGIAAGTVTMEQHSVTPITGAVFHIGDLLGYIGAGCFLMANLCITATIAQHVGWRALPGGLLLLAASVSFLDSHIFWPRGVFTMVAVAVGMFLLALAQGSPQTERTAQQATGIPSTRTE